MSFLVCSVSDGSPEKFSFQHTRYLRDSCQRFGFQPVIFWTGKPFTTTYDLKIVHLLECLSKRSEEHVLYVDAWDTVVFAEPAMILKRFLDFGVDLLFSASRVCHPSNFESSYPVRQDGNPFQFLGAGGFMGQRTKILECLQILKEKYQHTPGRDQPMWVESFCQREIDLSLDHGCHIFQNVKRDDAFLKWTLDGPTNTITQSQPLVFHTPEGGKILKYRSPNEKIVGDLYNFLFNGTPSTFRPESAERPLFQVL